MKKKLLLMCLLLTTLLFMGCDSSSSNSRMTIVNDSTETITVIEVRFNAYLAATSKIATYENSLDDEQVVEQNESVEYDLLPIVSDSTIRVRFETTYIENGSIEPGYSSVYLDIDKDANFTLHYNGESSKFTISGTGATFSNVV